MHGPRVSRVPPRGLCWRRRRRRASGLVVGGPSLDIAEHRPRLVQGDHPFCGTSRVGVMLLGEGHVGRPDHLTLRFGVHPENRVVIGRRAHPSRRYPIAMFMSLVEWSRSARTMGRRAAFSGATLPWCLRGTRRVASRHNGLIRYDIQPAKSRTHAR